MNQTEAMDEIRPALLQVCEIVRSQQETMIEMRTALIALLGALKDNNRAFASSYAAHFMAAQESVLHRRHAQVLQSISYTVRRLQELEW